MATVLVGVPAAVGEVAIVVVTPQVGVTGEVTIVVAMGEVVVLVLDIVETGDWVGGFCMGVLTDGKGFSAAVPFP